jgi:hypothetical protein
MKSGVDYAKVGWEGMKKELVNNIIVFFVASLTCMILGIGVVSMFYCAQKVRKGEKLEIADGLWALKNNPVQPEGEKHIRYGNLRTTDLFEDFNIKLEVNVPAGSNSGVYLRGIYEIQVSDSYGRPLNAHNMGGL